MKTYQLHYQVSQEKWVFSGLWDCHENLWFFVWFCNNNYNYEKLYSTHHVRPFVNMHMHSELIFIFSQFETEDFTVSENSLPDDFDYSEPVHS